MSRITKTFKRLKKEGRKALIPFITAGDPNLKETHRLIQTLEEAGADMIELGVPFSDPMADGPVIQASSERALKNGITLNKILGLVKEVRRKSQIPLLLMGYYNPIFVMGLEVFAKKASEAQVDAVLIVDLPPEEAGPVRKVLKKNKIDLIFLLAPTSDESRVQKVLNCGLGFIYYVSLTGVTGANLSMGLETKKHIQSIREKSKLPVVIGFGISNPIQARHLASLADGVVVGSALVLLIAKCGKRKNPCPVAHRFVQSLRKALDNLK